MLYLDVYVDDIQVQATCDKSSEVIDTPQETGYKRYDIITEKLHCTVAVKKAAVVASSTPLAQAIRSRLKPLALQGPEIQSTPALGADFTAGRTRKHNSKPSGSKLKPAQHARVKMVKVRRGRLHKITKHVGPTSRKLVKQGILPAALY